jgi:hypothetical protein
MTEAVPDTASSIQRFRSLGFFPADHAAAEGGKVYANGAYWNRLRFPEFPAVLPSTTVVAVLEQPFHAALADHQFRLRLHDSDGNALPNVQVEGKFRSGLTADGNRFGDSSVIPLTVQLNGLRFDEPGDYKFVLEVDGDKLDEYSFRAIQVLGTQAGVAPA